MRTDFPIVVMISGRGSNLQALLANAQDFSIVGVVSDRIDAPGLRYADEYQVPWKAFPRSNFQNKADQKDAIYAAVEAFNPKLIALAGFMQIVEPAFIERWPNRILNIHPSLLPEFPGLNTHQRVLAAKSSEHGCTVHFVDSGLDTGLPIAQIRCPVFQNDTEATLAMRILEAEHQLYPWVVNAFGRGEISWRNDSLQMSERAGSDAFAKGITLKW